MATLSHRIYRTLWRQPWLSLRHKKSLYKKLSDYGEVLDVPFEADFFGLSYAGNLNNSIEFNIYYYGAFEKPLLFFLRDTLNSIASHEKGNAAATCFCDIGANIGQHSLFMSRYATRVHAFEPFPLVNERLKRHIARNGIDNIHLHEVGLSDSGGELNFFAPTGRNQGIGSFDASTVSKGNVESGKLPLAQGDDYFEEQHIGRVDLIKIDVEGFEKKVIQGLAKTLRSQRPVLVCEISYGKELSFTSERDLRQSLPPDYELLTFDTRKPDGSKARRRGARARETGKYRLIPFTNWLARGQDDVIACPAETMPLIPLKNP